MLGFSPPCTRAVGVLGNLASDVCAAVMVLILLMWKMGNVETFFFFFIFIKHADETVEHIGLIMQFHSLYSASVEIELD